MDLIEKTTFRNNVNSFFAKHFSNTKFYKMLSGFSEYMFFVKSVLFSVKKLSIEHMDAFSRVVINQVRFTGSMALPLLAIISLSIGATTIIQAVTFLPKFGQDDFIGNLLKMVIVREIGPLITAIVILTRSGSAIASELATQKLHREIEAIELMGINPLLLIILPRVIAGLIAVAVLIIYFDFIAFFGGYLISRLVLENTMPFQIFMDSVLKSIGISDILSTGLKSLVYGLVIPLTCSYYGFKPNTLYEIPIFVSRAVIRSLFSVFLLNGIISVIFYL